ncbi:hypothetical protein [Paracoccus jeotgali]|uniref:hypothetical protein n=1 Tax=Paracoccus jeotgali TaxID=2065379 RepID=UPI0028A5A1E6|nr:hypothetical protein [Paracoccus jeotgali]
MSIHAFTSCSYSYLNRARVLAQTLKQQHPDWVLWLVMTDKPPPGFDPDPKAFGFDAMLTAEDLFGDETESWLFGHDIVEACTAVKGRACVHLLDQPGCEKLFYFDPDIAVLNPMDEVVALLDDHAIVLTPHQVEAEPASRPLAIRDNEIESLQYGVFNLGFIALANDAEGRRFAAWWDDRLHDWCHDDLQLGIFVDQKWCNLVPCFFDRVKVLRDPGYNVASWNLSQRRMEYDDHGQALINGRPLRFYHFTKLGAVGDMMTQRYAGDNIEIYELWWWYRHQVAAATSDRIPPGWWHYGHFDNGETIPKSARILYRRDKQLQADFPRPLITGEGSFHDWLRRETTLLSASPDPGRFAPV